MSPCRKRAAESQVGFDPHLGHPGRTVNGTARATTKDKDFNAANGTLTIPASQLQGMITLQIKPDRKREPDETFTVELSNPVNATIDDGTATVTILNDDSAKLPPPAGF